MKKDSNSNRDIDYFQAGKFQFLIALLAYMQFGYWIKIGKPLALEVGRVSQQVITAIDWTSVVLMVVAIIPMCRGIYLMRKYRRKS